jgi:polar amino acid transport system substrate-binding protein
MPDAKIVAELAPTGVLRAAINMGNFLLVTGKAPNGDPTGVSPDMALAIGARLGVPVKFIPYARPGEIADDAEKGLWDIGNIGAEPQRAAVISFTAAYAEIEATYLVPAGSPIKAVGEIDQPGKRLAVTARSAYGLWLENNYKKGELVQFDNAGDALKAFDAGGFDAYAGLRPGLIDEQAKRSGSRILDGQFTAVQQAVGTPKKNAAGFEFLKTFVEEAKKKGLVGSFIERQGTVGRLSVAPSA